MNKKVILFASSFVIIIAVSILVPLLIILEKFDKPIRITSNAHFYEYEFPGEGSPANPFIIEGYRIRDKNEPSIFIANVTLSFTIRNCILSSISNYGIYIENFKFRTANISYNSINSHSSVGIYLKETECSTIIVANNTLKDNLNGILILNCQNEALIANNTFENSDLGISIGNSPNHEISNNFFNQNRVGIYSSSNVKCTFSNNRFFGTIINTTDYNKESCGIKVIFGNYLNISNNLCDGFTKGMHIGNLLWSNITSNTCKNNIDGISVIRASTNIFENNICTQNEKYGLFLYRDEEMWGEHVSVLNNSISDNKYGIYLEGGTADFLCFNNISNNDYGIFVEEDHVNLNITYNNFKGNKKWAIYLKSGYSNKIHHNNFLNNNIEGLSQARDEGFSHIWYDVVALVGNFWSDWNQTGYYYIEGSAGSIDYYPLLNPIFLFPYLI